MLFRSACIECTGIDAYDQILDNIELAHKIRNDNNFDCGLFVSSIEYNPDAKVEMAPVFDRISSSVDEHYWLPLHNQGGYVLSDGQAKNSTGNQTTRPDKKADHPICWGLFGKTNITWDGKLSACCYDHKNEFNMGDLTKNTFEECWNSVKFQGLRQRHIDGDFKDLPCFKCLNQQHRGGEDDAGAHFALKD